MADKSKWKTPSMESEGKGDGHRYGRKPRTPEPIPIAGNSPSEEEMGRWTPTGIEPTDYDDDDDEVNTCLKLPLSLIISVKSKLISCAVGCGLLLRASFPRTSISWD